MKLTLSSDGVRLSKNYFDLPRKLSKLKSLRYFDFSGNRINNWLPILSTKTLRHLNVCRTSIDEIPAAISNLNRLEVLDLSDNNISELPVTLKELKQLRILNLSNNPLLKLPNWISEMTSLRELNVSNAQLTTLPESVVQLSSLESLGIKKNDFSPLPRTLLEIPESVIVLEERHKALYDEKIKAKVDSYPKGVALFEDDFNFKLQVIQKLMYEEEVLLPKFSIYDFIEKHTARNIDIEEEGYDTIPEVEAYFKALAIPLELLMDIKELSADGGDTIYSQLIPLWDGEDGSFVVESVGDVSLLPNLASVDDLFYSEDAIKELLKKNIEVT